MLLAALLAGATAPAISAAALVERLPDVASRFCVDLVSHAIPVPAVGDEERRVLGGYGLVPGIPNAALQAVTTFGDVLISGASLASGDASDGAFIVASGGAAGETCRVIVYRAPADGGFVQGVTEAMKRPGRDWRTLPVTAQPPGMLRLSLFKRDTANHSFLANIIAPVGPNPIAMVINVAAVPSTVAVPQGF